MPHTDLPAYRDGFFEKFLADLPGTPTLQALQAQQPSGQPLVLMADAIEYTGNPVTVLPNATITPRFAIRTGGAGATQTFVTLWLVERLDVATDTQETIARILADFHPATETGAAEAGGGTTTDLARTWAKALTADAVRKALARNLGEITSVPAGLPTQNLDELKSFLQHFATYKADGTYYAKGTVPEGTFPAGVNAATYFAPDTGNIAEVKVQRDRFYCSALVSERLWNPQADATRFRQLVYRIEDRGADAGADRWRLALLHTVGTVQSRANPASRFVFYFAEVGLGLAVPQGAHSALSASTAALVEHLSDPGVLATALTDPQTPVVGTPEAPYVLLIGAVKPGFPTSALPEGVIEDGEGAIRTFRCPPAHVVALASRDDVENVVLSTPVWFTMTQALQKMNAAGRVFPAGVSAANAGEGVVIGIVDSGIDGGHPAFLGRKDDPTKSRIHSVWNMFESGGDSPWKRASSANKDAYRSMNFGKEYVGESEVTTTQNFSPNGSGGHDPGHGTHVSGIAAGRGFGTWPGGVAPGATIVVAAVGTIGGYVNDVVAGVKYCFQKAAELGKPCVVNISLGTERHSHDGTDPLSIALTQLVSEDVVPAAGLGTLPGVMPRYKAGRVICAAAGNNRTFNLHWQATIPAGGEVSAVYQPTGTGTGTQIADGVTFWAYNEDATTVRLRISTRHSSNPVLATAEVPLMNSNHRVQTNFPTGLQVNIHNGPEAPNNRHFNPEVYWIWSGAAGTAPGGPWIIRLRNEGRAPCVIHGFAAFREHAGAFVNAAAQTQPLIGVTYTPDQLRQFESCKVSTPGTAAGVVTVAAYTSRPVSASDHVDDLAWFSSPGPLRAAAPGQRAIDCAMPGHAISSAKSWMPSDTSRGVVDMSGTSMATPMMTGLVAGLLQQNPSLTTGNILVRLENASTRRPADTVDDWGLGRVDAALFRA
jgi:subtilisin family serine protease